MKEYGLAVFIGRFQPFHNEHLKVVEHGLKIADRVLILIGSASASRSVKNPFTFEERKNFIFDSVPENVIVDSIDDYFYSEETWTAAVQNSVEKESLRKPVALIGSYKDASSYYLNSFPQWSREFIRSEKLDATSIREIIFQGRSTNEIEKLQKLVPAGVLEFLTDNFFRSSSYQALSYEYEHLEIYKARWESSPYPPTFVTVDAVVIRSGHVALIRRGVFPGKGLLALPGGFVKQNETLLRAAHREFTEETGLTLNENPIANTSFDYPGRSQRGRTITHAYFWDLGVGALLPIAGADDAAAALWMPINQLKEVDVYEDHFHIIQSFISHNRRTV